MKARFLREGDRTERPEGLPERPEAKELYKNGTVSVTDRRNWWIMPRYGTRVTAKDKSVILLLLRPKGNEILWNPATEKDTVYKEIIGDPWSLWPLTIDVAKSSSMDKSSEHDLLRQRFLEALSAALPASHKKGGAFLHIEGGPGSIDSTQDMKPNKKQRKMLPKKKRF